jgi:pseudaminic acid synthase
VTPPPVLVVAEIGANHGQNFDRAMKLIDEAKACGADAVKFQTYTPDTLTLNVDNPYFRIRHSPWRGQTLYELYRRAYTPWVWFKRLKKAADNAGIAFFATSFDKTSVDFLEDLGVTRHKIASFELVDLPLIGYVARTRKPLIMSTGMASLGEITEAVATAKKGGARDLTLLKCVSTYPSKPGDMNLKTIPDLRRRFRLSVGLSDHSYENGGAIAAVALGATMVEKHFTLSRKIKTPDSFFSLEPRELRDLTKNIRAVEQALGRVHYGLTADEKENRIFRRSLFVTREIRKGEKLSAENVGSIRPGYGLPCKYLKQVLGATAAVSVAKGTPLKWKMIIQKKSSC